MEIFQMNKKTGRMCPKCHTELIDFNNRHTTCPKCDGWPPPMFRLNPEKIPEVRKMLEEK